MYALAKVSFKFWQIVLILQIELIFYSYVLKSEDIKEIERHMFLLSPAFHNGQSSQSHVIIL